MATTDPALTAEGHATMSVARILADSAERYADRPAIHFGEQSITYRELWSDVLRYAGALRAQGVGKGDRVALIAPNVPDFPRVYYATIALGAVVVPMHPLLKAAEIEYILRDSGARIAIVAAPMLAEAVPAVSAVGIPVMSVLDAAGVAGVPRLEVAAGAATPLEEHLPLHPFDPATVLYTSGTTGTPKGAVSSQLSLVEQAHCSLLDSVELRRDDVMFGGLPLFHTFGQTVAMNTVFRRGAALALLPRFEPEQALAVCRARGVTVLAAVPTMFIDLLTAAGEADELPGFRFAISGGASLPVAVLEAFEARFGAQVHEGYGLTETAPVVSVNSIGEPIRPGTVGRPMWGVDARIAAADVEGRIEVLTEPGEIGEIVVRGHNLFNGYLGRPEATAEAVVDGWLRTGDLGTLVDGILTIVDRKKDLIIRNGYNVYPSEVEGALVRHPEVSVAAVFGVADDRTGQEVHAAVVLTPGSTLTADELIAYGKERLAAFKYPRVVHLRHDMPLGPSGKVLRRALAAEYAGE